MLEKTINIIEQLLIQNQRLLERLDAKQHKCKEIYSNRYRMSYGEKYIEKQTTVPQRDSKETELKQDNLLFVYCKKEPTVEMVNYISQKIGNVSEKIEIPTIKRNVIRIIIKELRNVDKARKLLQDNLTKEKAPIPYFVSSKFKTSEQTIILPGITSSQVNYEMQRIFDRKLIGKLIDICINFYRGKYNIKINLRKEDYRILFPNYCSYILGYDKRLTLTCNFPSYYQKKDIIETLKEKLEGYDVEFIDSNVKIFFVQSKLNPGRKFIKMMYKANNETEMKKLMNDINMFGRKLKPLISYRSTDNEISTRTTPDESKVNDVTEHKPNERFSYNPFTKETIDDKKQSTNNSFIEHQQLPPFSFSFSSQKDDANAI